MARSCPTARKSTDCQPTGQLAPWNMPPPLEPQHDSPPRASQEEEPFEIELVVHGGPTAQGSPAEEQQQQEDHNVDNEDEDKDDEEYSPLSDNEGEKLYREMLTKVNHSVLKHQSPPAGFVPCWDTWASPLPQDIRSRESCVQGGWNSRQLQRSSLGLGSSAGIRSQPSKHLSVMLWLMPPHRPSLLGAIATRMNCRTPSTASCLNERTNSRPLG
jgi:hypothetical protein